MLEQTPDDQLIKYEEWLPPELWLIVIDFLSLEDLFILNHVDRTFHEFALNSFLRRKTPQAMKLQARLFQFWIDHQCVFKMQPYHSIIWNNLCKGNFACESFGYSLFLLTRQVNNAGNQHGDRRLMAASLPPSLPVIDQQDKDFYRKGFMKLFLIRTAMPFFNPKERLAALRMLINDLNGEQVGTDPEKLFTAQINVMEELLQCPQIDGFEIADLDAALANIYECHRSIDQIKKIGQFIWNKLDEASQTSQLAFLQSSLSDSKQYNTDPFLRCLAKLTFLPESMLNNLTCWEPIFHAIDNHLYKNPYLSVYLTKSNSMKFYRTKWFDHFAKATPDDIGKNFFYQGDDWSPPCNALIKDESIYYLERNNIELTELHKAMEKIFNTHYLLFPEIRNEIKRIISSMDATACKEFIKKLTTIQGIYWNNFILDLFHESQQHLSMDGKDICIPFRLKAIELILDELNTSSHLFLIDTLSPLLLDAHTWKVNENLKLTYPSIKTAIQSLLFLIFIKLPLDQKKTIMNVYINDINNPAPSTRRVSLSVLQYFVQEDCFDIFMIIPKILQNLESKIDLEHTLRLLTAVIDRMRPQEKECIKPHLKEWITHNNQNVRALAINIINTLIHTAQEHEVIVYFQATRELFAKPIDYYERSISITLQDVINKLNPDQYLKHIIPCLTDNSYFLTTLQEILVKMPPAHRKHLFDTTSTLIHSNELVKVGTFNALIALADYFILPDDLLSRVFDALDHTNKDIQQLAYQVLFNSLKKLNNKQREKYIDKLLDNLNDYFIVSTLFISTFNHLISMNMLDYPLFLKLTKKLTTKSVNDYVEIESVYSLMLRVSTNYPTYLASLDDAAHEALFEAASPWFKSIDSLCQQARAAVLQDRNNKPGFYSGASLHQPAIELTLHEPKKSTQRPTN